MKEEERNGRAENEGVTEADRRLGVELRRALYWSELDIAIQVRRLVKHHRSGDRVADGNYGGNNEVRWNANNMTLFVILYRSMISVIYVFYIIFNILTVGIDSPRFAISGPIQRASQRRCVTMSTPFSSSAATRIGSDACAWCLASFPLQSHTSTLPAYSLRARGVLQPRRRRAYTLSIQPTCSATENRETPDTPDEDEGENENSGNGNSDEFSIGDDGLLVDMDSLRRRIREIEIKPPGTNIIEAGDAIVEDDDDNAIEVEVEVDVRNADDASTEEAMQLLGMFENVKELWVIVFASRDRKEGVYSLEYNGENIVLAFQERSEAQRYATLLEKQQFPTAKVCRLESEELREFCMREGFRLGFVPLGSISLSPPNESAIDDNKHWLIGDNAENNNNTSQGEADNGDNDGSSGLSQDELNLMKRNLDNLFGK